MTRFSPVSGTTSATVAIATSFSNDSRNAPQLVGRPSERASSACTSLNATPAPHKFFSGYPQSRRLGFSTASAGGSSASGKW